MAVQGSAEFKDHELKDFLNKLSKNYKKIPKGEINRLNAAIGTIIAGDVDRHFLKQEGPDGPWNSWSDFYEKIMGGSGKTSSSNMLKITGRLRNSFRPSSYRKTGDGLLWYNPATTKSGFPYAYAHDNDDSPRTILPRRSFMWLTKDALENIAKETLEVLLGA